MERKTMIYEYPYLEYLDQMTIRFVRTVVAESSLRIMVRDLRIWNGFPGYDAEVTSFKQCTLRIENSVFSMRRVAEYTTESWKTVLQGLASSQNLINLRLMQNAQSVYTKLDGPFLPYDGNPEDLYQFYFEGVSEELQGFVGWYIIAKEIKIEP